MPITEVKQHWVLTCDCCGEMVTKHSPSRPPTWVGVVVSQDALDFQGQAVADLSVQLLLCRRCGDKVVTGMNDAVNSLIAATRKPKEEDNKE